MIAVARGRGQGSTLNALLAYNRRFRTASGYAMSMLTYSESAQVPAPAISGRDRVAARRGGDRIRMLLVYSKNVPGWKRVIGDTVSGLLRTARVRLSKKLRDWRYLRFLVAEEYASLSYVVDWREAFRRSAALDIDACNITDLFEYGAYLRRIRDYELIVILHSAAGDNMSLLSFAAPMFQNRRAPLVVFFGNEYTLMSEKIRFAQRVGAEYIASQLPTDAARWLYAACPASRILSLPAALNPQTYRPLDIPRPIDIGFRGALYQHSIGDAERTRILSLFRERSRELGLDSDIEFTRFPSDGWNEFLNRCKGTVGAEAGTYYLERDDRTQRSVEQYLLEHPDAGFEEVHGRFFRDYSNPVSGKAISSRHFEAVGSQTCQILLEGRYNGILKANEHYISLRKDHSNIDEVVARFRDDDYRLEMVRRTWEYAMDCHTYDHRVNQMLASVTAGVRQE